MAGQSVPS
ncbi:hypothetical protein D043_1279A, partial [Vibrio parahaemolyticus EKP-021]